MILLAQIGSAQGIKGEVRAKSHCSDPSDLKTYDVLYDASEVEYKIDSLRVLKSDIVVIKFKGVDSRNAAESLNGKKLYVLRASLPPSVTGDEYYITDLVGLDVFAQSGEQLGKIISAPNFGAGDLLEISPFDDSPSWYLSFTSVNVPEVDITNNRVVIAPPKEV